MKKQTSKFNPSAIAILLALSWLYHFSARAQIGDAIPVNQNGSVPVNPILNDCLKPNQSCPIPSAPPGHSFRMFLPGATPQETTGYYDRNMVWLSKPVPNPPANAKFKVEAFFAPICPSNVPCVAQSFRMYYQTSALNQPPGQKRFSPKNNFSAPMIVTREDILKNGDPLASILLTGSNHSFADCIGTGSGSCVIGTNGGVPQCLNASDAAAMQSYSGNSYCAVQNGCPTGWTDVSDKDGNNPCGGGICCH